MARVPNPTFSGLQVSDDEERPLLPVTRAGRLSAKRLPHLTREEAKRLTKQVQDKAAPAWLLIERAHQGKAHEALAFNTWKDYTEKELGMSESRSFQLLDQARVMREIAAAGFDVADADPIPARVVAKVKNHLPQVREAAEKAHKEDGDIYAALRDLAQAISPTPSKPNTPATPRQGEAVCPCCNGTGVVPEMVARLVAKALKDAGV